MRSEPHSLPQALRLALLLALLAAEVVAGRQFSASAGLEPPLFDPATGYRINRMIDVVPRRIEGGVVLGLDDLEELIAQAHPILIDVYDDRAGLLERVSLGMLGRRGTRPQIADSAALPGFGSGVLAAPEEADFARRLKDLTHGDPTRPVVFYCLANCWTSWNAARRAIGLGYRNVHWFRDGVERWQDAGLPVVDAAAR
jgi:PQQ-dependent catabolism-associated CXXCW motif protein